VLLGSYQASS